MLESFVELKYIRKSLWKYKINLVKKYIEQLNSSLSTSNLLSQMLIFRACWKQLTWQVEGQQVVQKKIKLNIYQIVCDS